MTVKYDILIKNMNKLPEDDLPIEGKRHFERMLYESKKGTAFMSLNLDALWDLLAPS